MKYKAFTTRDLATEYIWRTLGDLEFHPTMASGSQYRIDKQYRPTEKEAGVRGDIFVIWTPTPNGGRNFIQEDGHLG